ncbi:MAG: hypothetical protein AB7F64_08290, partial [Gammaproteobacteria bacterium]
MSHHFAEFLVYLGEAAVTVAAVLMIFAGIVSIIAKNKNREKEKLEIEKINDRFTEMTDLIQSEILTKEQYKKFVKDTKKAKKAEEKSAMLKKRIYVLRFDGDMHASEVS